MVQAIVIAIFPAIVRLAIPLPVCDLRAIPNCDNPCAGRSNRPCFFADHRGHGGRRESCARNASGQPVRPSECQGTMFNSSRKELILSGALARAQSTQSPASPWTVEM